jgi:sterol 3beta-glucosyltransferase
MRITILALGSRGDVQPYVALGAGLKQAGFAPRLVTFENFEPMVRAQGLDFHPVKGDVQAMLTMGSGANLAEAGNNPIRFYRAVKESFGSIADDYVTALSADVLQDSDIIVNQLPASLFGYDLAEKLGVPYLVASVIPLYRTRAWPLVLFPMFSMGGWFNALTYRVAEQMAWGMFRSTINQFRTKIGLSKAPFWGHFGRMMTERVPVINGFSTHTVPRPADWGDHVHVTGYWLLDEPDWTPPPDLVRFLCSGAKPVFVGFGSVPTTDAERLTHVIVEASRQSDVRVILSSGWANLGQQELPETILKIGYVPYPWLLPQMAAVVHHGGSGTTGQALRAGVPSMVVPFAADQFYWGSRVMELGAGPAPIPYKQLSAENLAAALEYMISDEHLKNNAAILGEKLRAENGVTTAVQVIETYLKPGSSA